MTTAPHIRLPLGSAHGGRPIRAADIVAAVISTPATAHAAGCRLPPVRVLAHQLGLSKNTVAAAYDELVARGAIEGRPRRGYYLLPPAPRRGGGGGALPAPALPVLAPPALPAPSRRAGRIALSRVFVDPDLLPRARLAACFRSVLRTPGLPTYYDAQGYPPLREAIARRLVARGIPARADDVIITTGSQQGLDVVCRALRDKRIATENPAYGIGKRLFELNGVVTTPLDLDPFAGIDPARWEAAVAAARPGLLYLTSSFHNPTGYSYSTAELTAILALSARHGCGILEDDWGSDMLSYSQFRPPLRALGGDHVLYLNSFTKKLLPALRVGYLVANRDTVAALIEAKRVATLGNPTLIEAALFEFLDRGYFDRHLATLQQELDRRYQRCLDALTATMPDTVRWTTPGGGPLLWLELPRQVDLAALQRAVARRGVDIELSSESFFAAPHLHGCKIGYAFPRPDDLARGLNVVADEVRRADARAARRATATRASRIDPT